jgi:hypothetical protein
MSFSRAMTALAVSTAADLAWIALPGGAYCASFPPGIVAVYACFVLAIWARCPPA